MQLNGLLEFIDLNRTGFRKALKKHDKVLGDLPHHSRLQPEYLPEVDDKFADKNRPHLQVYPMAIDSAAVKSFHCCHIALVPGSLGWPCCV